MSQVEKTHVEGSGVLSIPALPDDSFEDQQGEVQDRAPAEEAKFSEMTDPSPVTVSEKQFPVGLPQTTVILPQNRNAARKKATAPRDQHDRLPSSKSSSVFNRLYKTHTAASKAWMPARAQARARTGKSGVADTMKVFERLHLSSTYSNSCKRKQQRHPPSPLFKSEKTRVKVNVMRSPAKTPSLSLSTTKSPRKNYVYSPRMKPLTKLYFDSKYHPGLGVETIEPIKLGFSFFQSFCEYENGGLTSQDISREIILAFFKKDFPAGRHWEMQEPVVEERPGEVDSFNVKMSATYDWTDGLRVAVAKGVVRCKPDEREVRVKNYIYKISGY